MTFIAQFGSDLKEGQAAEFQEWLNENEKELANAHPAGARYIGTYFTIYGDRQSGGVQMFVELDSYGAQDALAAEGRRPDSVFGKLVNEMIGFLDQTGNNGTSALYKSVTAATIWGED